MSLDMQESVTARDSLLPVLIPAARGGSEDGYGFERGSYFAVRVLPPRVSDAFRGAERWKKFCIEYGETSEDVRVNLLALARLTQAIQTRSVRIYERDGEIRAAGSNDLKVYVEIEGARRARKRVAMPLVPPDQWSSRQAQAEEVWNEVLPVTGDPFGSLCKQLGDRTKSGHLILWWGHRDKILRAGLYFESVEDAIFALFTTQVALPQGMGICERCSKVFHRTRRARKFCSTRCGNYVRKYRERQKSRR